MEFEIYTKDVEITLKSGKTMTLTLRPLTGRFYPKFMSIVTQLMDVDKEAEQSDVLKKLDEPTVEKLHLLLTETLKKSYPTEKPEVLDEFVSQNMFVLLEPFMEVNINDSK
jgi:hypothetical protein